MTQTITFVTGNQNKLKEVVYILGGTESEEGNKVGNYVITNKSLDIEEVQGTIDEVTIQKARSAAKLLGGPVLVEDTCLAFNAFNDLPGPYIKWFVKGVGLQGLVDMLYKFDDKGAKAVCTFGYCEGPDSEVKLFQGITHGLIVQSRGHQNFGWDSIFEPTGFNETYAEMDKSLKNTISHRSRALEKVKEFLLSN
ncbi:CIC11C00000002605 [Sungouiella intermedia]|uniref:Inosine triphosphate pyrophosphatase n=1 Tax=Sungouiella intermedia TaxID=45354 RepID=A0A1L0D408_9ASCO|nr:CIC11C00000002605 [[Candida] intermedia]SGZ50712.1 CIC11C00000002723 [[Candida] intermedia]